MFTNFKVDTSVEVIFALLNLVTLVLSARSRITTYTADVKSCSPQIMSNKSIIETQTCIRGQVECMERCTNDDLCEVAVYQEFLDSPASCTKLSGRYDNISEVLEISASSKCRVMFVYPCFNGGKLHGDVCLCQKGYAGQKCELTNPSFCQTEWTRVTIPDPYNVIDFTCTAPKILFRNQALNVTSVMKGMNWRMDKSSTNDWGMDMSSTVDWRMDKSSTNDWGIDKSSTVYWGMDRSSTVDWRMDKSSTVDWRMDMSFTDDSYWYFVTFPFMEKIAWKNLAPNPKCQLLHVSRGTKYPLSSFDGSTHFCKLETSNIKFDLIIPKQMQFSIKRTMPEDWSMIVDDLNSGYDMFRMTWVMVDDVQQTINAGLEGWYLNAHVARGDLVFPSKTFQSKSGVDQTKYQSTEIMGKGLDGGLEVETNRDIYYLSPCWIRMRDDKYDGGASATGWKMLGTYLRLGHDVRVKVGPMYHSVLEVIQMEDCFTFVLAPFLPQTDTSSLNSTPLGIRNVISSSGIYQSCTHIEGEDVIPPWTTESSHNLTWFVDTRKWSEVYSVSSSSRVLHGSVARLISGIKAGCDVRLWIKWIRTNTSRFMDTHASSFTDDGQVSTESLITWRTTQGPYGIKLSWLCDLQYILATSEGYVEILFFSFATPGVSEVQSDVVITWFLA